MLTGGGESSTFMFNGLKNDFPIANVIIEGRGNKKKFIKKRIKRLGYVKVFGQILFSLFVPKTLKKNSKKRIDEIKSQYQLDATEIPSEKIKNVPSVNSKECISFLQKEKPDLIIVNGTRIISKKVLTCIDTTFVNTHVGITPKYRGVHGGYWALANDDRKNCGVTVHLVDTGIDTGGVLFQKSISPNEKDNFTTYTYLQIGEGIQLMHLAIADFSENKLQEKKSMTSESKIWSHPTLWYYLYTRISKGVK
ncbi:Formyl transferase [Pricia antarctica]|uniref:phosphoribosylglycinamide formyltransferase 1 n=2 Tax=Pricia antarctica TaxID=641691 RepID=A0A1G7FL26_9FLAO|nr:Formyl transferase [Pricia antarctica]